MEQATPTVLEAIGGYFGWEPSPGGEPWHRHARLVLNSGRSCLGCLADVERPAAVWVPHYCCDAVLQPLRQRNIPVHRYCLSRDFGIDPHIVPAANERIVAVNFFGLFDAQVKAWEHRFGQQVWIDNTQAFFYRPTDPRAISFNSARKFFGVPDGAFLYGPRDAALPPAETWPENNDYRDEHLSLRLEGRLSEGLEIFRENERLTGAAAARISAVSEAKLAGIDYRQVAQIRRDNFRRLHAELGPHNALPAHLFELEPGSVPFCYPFLPARAIPHRYLWEHDIFAPRLWPECEASGADWERRLARELLPLPIDQRYGPPHMQMIVEVIDAYQ